MAPKRAPARSRRRSSSKALAATTSARSATPLRARLARAPASASGPDSIRPARRAPPARAWRGHAEGQLRDDEHGAVAVHDEPGEAVGLAPDEPAELRRGAGGRRKGDGPGDPALEEGGVDGLVGPGEDAAAEGRARVVVAASDEPARGVHHGDGRARLDVAHVGDVVLEDPGGVARPGRAPPHPPARPPPPPPSPPPHL